jgi:hypothetical protein
LELRSSFVLPDEFRVRAAAVVTADIQTVFQGKLAERLSIRGAPLLLITRAERFGAVAAVAAVVEDSGYWIKAAVVVAAVKVKTAVAGGLAIIRPTMVMRDQTPREVLAVLPAILMSEQAETEALRATLVIVVSAIMRLAEQAALVALLLMAIVT